MYSMNVKLFGVKFNLVTVIFALLVGLILGGFMLCSCGTVTIKEGYSLRGAPLDYTLGVGVPGDTWSVPPVNSNNSEKSMYASLTGNIAGKVPLPDDELFMFYDNKFKPECCYKPQQYSSSTGCACISEEQMKFLSARGGNNTIP